MAQTVVLKVSMSCQGCAGAVKRVLDKMEGVESFDVDLKEQKVTVKGNVQPDAVLQNVSKSGKKTSFWVEEAAKEAPAVEEAAKEALAPEEAAKEAPAPKEAAKEAPVAEEAAKEAPAVEEAAKEAPALEEATKEAPTPAPGATPAATGAAEKIV